MKTFFMAALFLQFLIEIFVGVFMVLFAESTAPDAAMSEIFQLRNQGFIAISIGIATAMLWFQRKSPEVVGFATGFFVIYHTLVSMSGAINSTMGYDFSPMMLHVILALTFLALWVKRSSLRF